MKKAQINLVNWFLEIGAILFLTLAIFIVYATHNSYLRFINIFISGIICGYILFKKKLKFRAIFITIAWVIGLIIGSKEHFLLVILVFIIGTIISYNNFKKKWFEF